MNYKLIASGILAISAALPSAAEAPAGFEEFRKGVLRDFDTFKTRILEHYADFLAGEWHEYESLEAEEKYSSPKPSAIPTSEYYESDEASEQKKSMLLKMGFGSMAEKLGESAPVHTPVLDWLKTSAGLYNASPLTEPQDNQSPTTKIADILTGKGIVSDTEDEIFNFYGMKFALPAIDFTIRDSLNTTLDYSYQWQELEKQKMAEQVIPGIKNIQKVSGISDYLVFEMIMAYLDNKFPTANDASKMSATHYLLTNMGFGVRIAMDNNGNPFILMPFTDKIFGRSGLKISKTFYVFSTPGRQQVKRIGLNSPYLPDNAASGADLTLRMDSLNLPMKPYHYSFEHNGLKIEGDMNENIVPMLYRYPQMETKNFAASTLLPDVRKQVVDQLKAQLGDEDPLKSADRLLSLIQYSFPYACDDEVHGFEKPYFFEETLFYPKSDCEDRSIFYSYLLWNALNVENDLIAYPNHEATALKAEKVWGGTSHYSDGTQKYFISDPTYLGAPTGQCMPSFEGVNPVIDLKYRKK